MKHGNKVIQPTRQQRWQFRMKLAGRCICCGKPATPETFLCEAHRQKANNGWAKGYAAKRDYFRRYKGYQRRNLGAKSYRP